MIPDKVFGTDLTVACEIHDWMYANGDYPRKVSDDAFHENLRTLFDSGNVGLLGKLVAFVYYAGVRLFGSSSYKGVGSSMTQVAVE